MGARSRPVRRRPISSAAILVSGFAVRRLPAVDPAQRLPGNRRYFHSHWRNLEYDLVVAPGADFTNIWIRVSGRRICISRFGRFWLPILRMANYSSESRCSYQVAKDGTKHSVEGRFRLLGSNLVGSTAPVDTTERFRFLLTPSFNHPPTSAALILSSRPTARTALG